VDIVVGAHSHTFLYPPSEDPPSVETPAGNYPTYIEQDSGKVVPVVQAYCYTKYIGHVEATFGGDGELLLPVNGAGNLLNDL